MEKLISFQGANQYLKKANEMASLFQYFRKKAAVYQEVLVAHRRKHKAVFEKRPVYKIIHLITVFAFAAVGVTQLFTVGPFFEQTVLSDQLFSEHPVLQKLVSFLPAIVIMGFCLGIGASFHAIVKPADGINPRPQYSHRAIISTGILSVIYAGFLYLLAYVGLSDIEDVQLQSFLILLPLMGVIELVLGFFAAVGLEIGYVYGRRYWLMYWVRDASWKMEYYSGLTRENEMMYKQVRAQMDEIYHPLLPEEMPDRVKEAIGFCYHLDIEEVGETE